MSLTTIQSRHYQTKCFVKGKKRALGKLKSRPRGGGKKKRKKKALVRFLSSQYILCVSLYCQKSYYMKQLLLY